RRSGTRETVGSLAAAVKAAIAGSPAGDAAAHPLVRLAAEIRSSIRVLGPGAGWMSRFLDALDGFVDMAVRAYDRWLAGAGSATLDDYLYERYHDIGVSPMLALMELSGRDELDERSFAHPDITGLRTTCIFTMVFMNDVFSYHREVIQTGNPTNAVAVMQL